MFYSWNAIHLVLTAVMLLNVAHINYNEWMCCVCILCKVSLHYKEIFTDICRSMRLQPVSFRLRLTGLNGHLFILILISTIESIYLREEIFFSVICKTKRKKLTPSNPID